MHRFFLLLLVLPAIALTPATKSPVLKQVQDYNAFEKVLFAKEGRLDLHQSADSMVHYLELLKIELSEELSLVEQYKAYSFALARLGCGHTQIHPSKRLLHDWVSDSKSLPLDFVMQGKRLYTNKLLTSDYDIINLDGINEDRAKTIKGNVEVISLDHKTVPEMIAQIEPYISSDEDAIDFKYHQIAQLFDFYRHLSSPFDKDSIQISYIQGVDTLETYLELGIAPVNTINTRLKKAALDDSEISKEIGSFEITNSKYGVFRFRSFSACNGNAYELFLEQSFRKIRTKNIEHVIIDLRGNTGGVMQYSLMRYFVGGDVELGRYVVEKPKRGFETHYLKKRNVDYRKHKWMSRIQRLQIWLDDFDDGLVLTDPIEDEFVYKGEIVVITDEGTFSSASMLACHLKTLCNARLVGRRAGGSFYRGNAGTIYADLPNSKFRLMVNPNTFYSQLTPTMNSQAIKEPDVIIDPSYLVPRKMDEFYIQAAIASFK